MTATRWFSLRRRLLGLLLGGLTACWLAAMVLIWNDSHHEIDELFDAQLAQTAQALLAQAEAEVRSLRHHRREASELEETLGSAHKYQRYLRCQIWHADGALILRSQSAPDLPMTQRAGFSEENGDGGHWRFYTQWNASGQLQVQVAEEHRIRDELVTHIVVRLMWPAIFGLILIALWVWLATRREMTVLDGIARQIASRAPQQLQAVTPSHAPVEIRPMLDALNDLLRRVDSALEAERRFTADAAHELRTPLAALQAQAQVVMRARDDAERQASLQHLRQGLERAAHLVEQILALARLDPESGLPASEPVALKALCAEVCADLGPLILQRQIDFNLGGSETARIAGHGDWLRLLVRNLVDNAVRYTPTGGHVEVRIASAGGNICLTVEDSGPGIPQEEREHVLHRFHRLDAGDMPGSGLGLSIVARIAELHGATLMFADSPLGGLAAHVSFAALPTQS